MKNGREVLMKNIILLEQAINYVFKEKKHIILALTHSSYANENKNEKLISNERLEFLGDAILNIIISEYIYTNYTMLTEGEMTKARAGLVCEASLNKCANNIELGKYLLLGKGEELTGGRMRASILSDAFEALIGSIYLDGGMTAAKEFIFASMQNTINCSINGTTLIDYKTQLQEFIQKNSDKKIIYKLLEEKGPDHNKQFVIQVLIADEVLGTGTGKSKKEAEQNAAGIALGILQEKQNV